MERNTLYKEILKIWRYIFGFVVFCVTSCSENRDGSVESKELEVKGKNSLIEYYESGSLKKVVLFNDKGNKDGEFLYFYENGALKRRANYCNGLLCGDDVVYHPNQNIKSVSSYFVQNKATILKEEKIYDDAGRVNNNESLYLDLVSEADTIAIGERFQVEIRIAASIFKKPAKNRFMKVVYGSLDSKFRILEPNKLDTIVGNNSAALVIVKPDKVGENVIRGFVIDGVDNNDGEQYGYIYFEKHFYVKSSHAISLERH